ncbi:MAG: ribonuclease HIII [Oligosphaeraceae bacterium]|nr:ribonuclease HIII [Oligosphaeraceae bacterium]
MSKSSTYVTTLTPAQIKQLQEILLARGWLFEDLQYAHWRAKSGKSNVVAYQSGRVTVQGPEMAELVQFTLEPEILKEARFGYETEWAAEDNPAMFQPHAGIDESGKGDFFGPLVIACCYSDGDIARKLLAAGVTDSKAIGSDKRIAELAKVIRDTVAGRCSVVVIGPAAYNRMYDSFQNLNRLLAWGHARALENLLAKVPDCPRAISDQFGRKENVLRALQERGRAIVLEQHPRAEADVAVAAASILARDEFVRRLDQLGRPYGLVLPKGAGPLVLERGRELLAQAGRESLPGVAKMHFKTAAQL